MPKTLVQTILGAFCAILCNTFCMGGGGMNIGARTSMWNRGAKISAKSYVQSGLVAMWDGIENAGWGVHSSELILVDLVSNTQYALPSSAIIGDNYVSFAMSASLTGTATTQVTALHTLEVCGCMETKPTSIANVSGFCSYCGSGVFLWRRPANDGGCGILGCASVLSDSKTHFYGFPTNLTIARSLADNETFDVTSSNSVDVGVGIDASSITGRKNGVAYDGTNTMNYTESYIGSTAFEIGNALSARTKINSFRVYNRVLTDEEKLHNYAVDKERFSLN